MLAEAYSNLGNVYKERGQLQEALEHYRYTKLVILKYIIVDMMICVLSTGIQYIIYSLEMQLSS